jgi:hypothetical protein
MSCEECECDHGPAVNARIEERPEPQETILDAAGALAVVNYGPLWANLLGDYHQHAFSSCHSVQEVFTVIIRTQFGGNKRHSPRHRIS